MKKNVEEEAALAEEVRKGTLRMCVQIFTEMCWASGQIVSSSLVV